VKESGLLERLRRAARRLPPPSLGLVPFPIQRVALERMLALVFREPLARDELVFLHGRRLRVTVTDAGLCWDVGYDGAALRIRRPLAAPDVELRGRLHTFALLATRRSDPDTLFFRRRLVVTGDTELGLACKNLMDSLEPESWHPLAPAVLNTLGRWLAP
jgi:predicted lipid carrier protein YhbT